MGDAAARCFLNNVAVDWAWRAIPIDSARAEGASGAFVASRTARSGSACQAQAAQVRLIGDNDDLNRRVGS